MSSMPLQTLTDLERLQYALEALIPKSHGHVRLRLERRLAEVLRTVDRERRHRQKPVTSKSLTSTYIEPTGFAAAVDEIPTLEQPRKRRLKPIRESDIQPLAPLRKPKPKPAGSPWTAAFPPAPPEWQELLACRRCQYATRVATAMHCPQGHGLELHQAKRTALGWEVK